MIRMVGSQGAFLDGFLTEEECIAYLFKIKWPNGFCCPRCGHTRAYTINTRRLPLFQCASCRHQTSLTAGTVMEGSRTPLCKWVAALHLVSSHSSINAVRLSEQIQVTYKTAWTMLRKIRQAIHETDEKQPLSGTVRAGLAFYGGNHYHQPFVKHSKEHPVIVSAGLRFNGCPDYIKIKVISARNMEGKHLHRSGQDAFVRQHVQDGTWDVKMLKRFQLHEVSVLPQVMKQAITWINRTFHGIGSKYLQSYWDEFCFRLNQSYRNLTAMDSLSRICMSA